MIKLDYVGKSINRVDGIKKVTGSTKFVDDIKFSSILYADVKRSPIAHGFIKQINLEKAKKLKGVKSIITGDYYKKRCGLYLEDKNFLAVNKVRYLGEPVVAVAAITKEIARMAIDLIEVEYEKLPSLTNAREAMFNKDILVHPDLENYKCAPVFFPKAKSNISNHYKLRKGDVETAFEMADIIVENDFFVPQVQHCPIETHTAVALMDFDGQMTVWAGSQSPLAVRQA